MVRHAQAKRLRLRVDPHGVRLTVPLRSSKQQIQQFLNKAENWLIETWQYQQSQTPDLLLLPETLQLFDQKAVLQIQQARQQRLFVWQPEQNLLLLNQKQPERCLKTAVLAYAKQALPEYLQRISQEIGLSYQLCHIRQPKTRWGSCSARHDIMLHAGAVLMSEPLVRYLCIHELAHTRHFNHSALFWAEVARYDPHYAQHRKLLKNYRLPGWWYALS